MRWRFLFFCCSFSTPTKFHTLWQIVGNELERNPLKYIGCLFYKPYTFLDCRFIFMMKFTLLFSSFGTMSCVVKQEAVFPLSFEAISPFCIVRAFAPTRIILPHDFSFCARKGCSIGGYIISLLRSDPSILRSHVILASFDSSLSSAIKSTIFTDNVRHPDWRLISCLHG